MPELTDSSRHKHPAVASDCLASPTNRRQFPPRYVELRCKSNFSFLRGASHPEELVKQAVELRYPAIGISDINTLAGVVRMHCAAKEAGLKLLVGAELTPSDGDPITLYSINRSAYGRLARLITTGKKRAPKGYCYLTPEDICSRAQDLIAIVHGASDSISFYRSAFADRLHLGVSLHCGHDDMKHLAEMDALARRHRLPLVAVNDVHYHRRQRSILQDVLVCIREGVKIADAGPLLFPNAERHLKSYEEMLYIFNGRRDIVERSCEVADRCSFSLDELRYEYPAELCPPQYTISEYLSRLTWEGAAQRYGEHIPSKVRSLIAHELRLISELAYEHYFLTVWDVVRFSRSRGILCQGRGSAANSAVCFCLGITSVDPERIDLLFERFVSAERNEPPDIDVDFEHSRREEVMQYIYNKYGRDRAAIVAEVITYRPRSAVRDVGKALGLSLDRVDTIARKIEWWSGSDQIAENLAAAGLDPHDRCMRMLVELCRQLLGFPRHLSQHVGGFVMTAGLLSEIVPIENAAMPDRTFIEWDKDDIDALGILKIDCLSLGMLSAIRRTFDFLAGSSGGNVYDSDFARSLIGRDANQQMALVPVEDPAVYEMIAHADTIGVFQVESRAQMSMLPRLKPRCFYDLVIEVAIVRPGPIQGGMVHPYLRRRNGEERVTYPSESVRDVLAKTLGVPLFQEQAMRLAVVAAGFSPGEADRLRRSFGVWRRSGTIEEMGARLVQGMLANGYDCGFAEQLFRQLQGFGEYGFPESHAASFALLVYVSSWLKRYYPAAFTAAIINSLPMGFYAPAQLVRDARSHGVRVNAVDVNYSFYDCTLEAAGNKPAAQGEPFHSWGVNGPDLRLGFCLVRGIGREVAERIVIARKAKPFGDIRELARRARLPLAVLARLAAADTFKSMGLTRREGLWAVLVAEDDLPLFKETSFVEDEVHLLEMERGQEVAYDYNTTGLSLKDHPMALVRRRLDSLAVSTSQRLKRSANGRVLSVAGLVLVRQRPSTAKGIVFMTVEDETGIANLIIRPNIYKTFRAVARAATAVIAHGRVERAGEVVHLQVHKLESVAGKLQELQVRSRDFC